MRSSSPGIFMYFQLPHTRNHLPANWGFSALEVRTVCSRNGALIPVVVVLCPSSLGTLPPIV